MQAPNNKKKWMLFMQVLILNFSSKNQFIIFLKAVLKKSNVFEFPPSAE